MAKKTTQRKKKPGRRIWRTVRICLEVFILIMLLTVLIVGLLFYNKYGKRLFELQSEAKILVQNSTLDTFRQSETSLVYDKDKKLISTLKGEKDVYYLAYEDIPEQAIDAMISIEDKKFLKHHGVDFKAIMRAGLALLRNKGEIHQGASTITQQLSRSIFLSNEKSWERKIKEMFIALDLEKKYEKYQIMEFYLNNIYFSNGYYGIQAASKGYFSKTADKLTLSEIAFLCAIPNSPTKYDPIDHKEDTMKRRKRILDQMLEDNKITQSEYEEAMADPVKMKLQKKKKNNYVETFVYYSAVRALMEDSGFVFQNYFDSDKEKEKYQKQYNELYDQFQQSLYHSGYRIYTSIDMSLQNELQKAVDEGLKDFTETAENGIYAMQGAAVCIDNKTGRVVAIVGGRKQDTEGYTLNRAYQSYRQPGSGIKPLNVYTPAFQMGYHPEQIVIDEKFEGGPRNSNGRFIGKVSLRTAVEKSINTIAWKIYEDITPTIGLSFLKQMGFAKIDQNDYFPASSIGGFTIGTSPVEMAAGFATIENDGIYREPTCIVRISNSKGEKIVGDKIKEVPVYDTNASRIMTDVLKGVLTKGTAAGYALSNMPSAGKTGTTNDKKDGWFIGYTPYYTTSVWVGYDTPKSVSSLLGNTYPVRIWKSFMEIANDGLEREEFAPYDAASLPKLPVYEEPEKEEVPGGMDDLEQPEDKEEPEEEQNPDKADKPDKSEQDNENSSNTDNETDLPDTGTGDNSNTDNAGNDNNTEEPLPEEEDNSQTPPPDTSGSENGDNSNGNVTDPEGSDLPNEGEVPPIEGMPQTP